MKYLFEIHLSFLRHASFGVVFGREPAGDEAEGGGNGEKREERIEKREERKEKGERRRKKREDRSGKGAERGDGTQREIVQLWRADIPR